MTPLKLLFLFIFCSLSSCLLAQHERVFSLRSERLNFTPKTYYFSDITDSRNASIAIGTAIVNGKSVPTFLEGNIVKSLKNFALSNWKSDTSLLPISIKIKELALLEKSISASRIEGKWQLRFSFEREYDSQSFPLTDYIGSVSYARPPNSFEFQETTLRKILSNSFQYFNNWITQNQNAHPMLARGVKVVFMPEYAPNVSNSDTVFYEARKLSWKDFLRRPPPITPYGAAVYSSFGYEATSKIINGVLNVQLRMKTFMIKSNSWVMLNAKDDYALRHEQLHFDITKLITERFKQKLAAEPLPLDDYDSRIQYIFLESFREMNHLQEQYDNETGHSVNHSAQERWIEKIENELKVFQK